MMSKSYFNCLMSKSRNFSVYFMWFYNALSMAVLLSVKSMGIKNYFMPGRFSVFIIDDALVDFSINERADLLENAFSSFFYCFWTYSKEWILRRKHASSLGFLVFYSDSFCFHSIFFCFCTVLFFPPQRNNGWISSSMTSTSTWRMLSHLLVCLNLELTRSVVSRDW